MLSQLRLSPILYIAREWLPALYLMQGYWLSVLFFKQPMISVEQQLLNIDHVVFRIARVNKFLTQGPRLALEYFELTYLFVYPLLPIGFGLFNFLSFRHSADNFWTAILIAGFGCYGLLPFIQTRPPRTFEEPQSPLAHRNLIFRRINLFVLSWISVRVNTFPSGHTAIAVAIALAIMSANSSFTFIMLAVASSISIATVLGRYHYTVDTFFGAIVGVLAWWISFHLIGA
jgi:membrane-associated phospholipid phosphatase